MNNDALGMPGTLKLINTEVAASVATCDAPSSTPYSLPANRATTTHDTAEFRRKVDTARGRAKFVAARGRPSTCSAAVIMAGSAAIDERVVIATTWAGRAARANCIRGTPATNMTARYRTTTAISSSAAWATI